MVTKEKKAEFAGMTCEQVRATMDEDDAPYRPPWHTQLFEIGKYVNYPEHREPFYDFDVHKECEGEFDILTRAGLKAIIEDDHDKVFQWYKEVAEDPERAVQHAQQNLREWSRPHGLSPYYLDQPKTDGPIVASWKREYAIFNLVHIYRFFDWEHSYLIYSGW